MSKKRSCKKGYGCGGGCISIKYICRKEFPEGVSITIDKARKAIKTEIPLAVQTPKPIPERNVNYDLDAQKEGSKSIGKGQFGEAFETKDGLILKEGLFTPTEMEMAKRIGDVGLGPKVLKFEKIGSPSGHPLAPEITVQQGRMLMEKVPGKSVMKDKSAEAKDARWVAKKNMNMAGFSHNDMNHYNVMWDGKKATLIDFAFAKESWGSAFVEALSEDKFKSGFVGKNRRKVESNLKKAHKELERRGVPRAVIVSLRTSYQHDIGGTEKKVNEYGLDLNDPKNEPLLKEMIAMVYEGVE